MFNGMFNGIKLLVTLIISLCMQTGMMNVVSMTPMEATEDFLDALKEQDKAVMEKYMDNGYVNFLVNAKGDEKIIDRMNTAIFDSFSYEIKDIGTKNDVAVAKIVVKSKDFSAVMAGYNEASYKYIMDNLYDDRLGDKKYLNGECLRIYVEQIEYAAKNGNDIETVVYVPMIDDGFYGWNIIMTDELMKSVLGNLEMPQIS